MTCDLAFGCVCTTLEEQDACQHYCEYYQCEAYDDRDGPFCEGCGCCAECCNCAVTVL